MKHVKIKKDEKYKFLEPFNVMGDVHSMVSLLTSGRAFGVNHVDRCSDTGKNRVHLLGIDGFEVFAWVFEEYTEEIG